MDHQNDNEDPLCLPADFGDLNAEQLRAIVIEDRQRCVQLEKEVFKTLADKRKLEVQYKALQETNTINAKNRNNTSSAFTLPSEFKQAWDELVTELMIDAFTNIDQY